VELGWGGGFEVTGGTGPYNAHHHQLHHHGHASRPSRQHAHAQARMRKGSRKLFASMVINPAKCVALCVWGCKQSAIAN